MCLYVQIAGQTGWTGLANDHILMIKHGYISNTLCLSGSHGYIHERAWLVSYRMMTRLELQSGEYLSTLMRIGIL